MCRIPCSGADDDPSAADDTNDATCSGSSLRKELQQLTTLRLFLADDHRLMLSATTRALADAPDLEIVGQATDGSRVLQGVRETQPHIVLLDLRMPELDGLACLARLQAHHPHVRVAILSSSSDEESIEAARAGGAAAFVVKTIDPGNLADAIRSAARGDAFAVYGDVPVDADDAGLSARETTVLAALARGLSNREIARSLWITDATIKFHLRNIYKKLGVSNRTEAARYAYRAGIIPSAKASG